MCFRINIPEAIKVQLIKPKAIITLLKQSSIPRLILIACNIRARLKHTVLHQGLCVPNMKTLFWWTQKFVVLNKLSPIIPRISVMRRAEMAHGDKGK